MSTGSTTAESGAQRFSRQVLSTIAVRLAIVASSLIAGAITARWLGASGVGILATLNVITLLAVNIGGLGLPSSLTLLTARDRAKAKTLFANAVVFGLVSGTVITAVIITAAWTKPGLAGEVPIYLIAIVAIALPVQMLSYLSMGIYLGLEKIRAYNMIDLALQGITLMNALVTLVVLGLGIFEFVVFSAVANVLAAVVISLVLGRDVRDRGAGFKFDASLMREMIGYGLRFFVAMAAGLVILRGDLLIVNYLAGVSEAGVYAVATQVATFLHLMPNVISTLLFPRTSATQDETGDLTCRVTRHAVFIMLVLCAVAVPSAFLLPLIYGPGFTDVPFMFLILLPGVFLLGIETIQVQHFSGLGLPRLIPTVWVLVMAFNIALNFLLVPRFGGYGAALSSTVSYFAVFVFVAGYFRSHTGRTFGEAFIIRRDELRELLNTVTRRTGEGLA